MTSISRALISVSDKTNLATLAKSLASSNVKLISTGGTATFLVEAGLAVTEVAEYTGFEEMLAGRNVRGWPGIDLVVVNLYPFESVVAKPETTFEEAVENIDIGGPCLLRASAKNHAHVAVLCDPADYGPFISEMERMRGELSPSFRRSLAQKAFARVSAYDKAISDYLAARV